METQKETLKQVITFLIITSIITTGIFIWMFNGAGKSITAVFIMMWTPGISAILTSLFYKDKISEYGWKPKNLRLLLYSYFLPLVVSIIGYGLVWLSGLADITTENVTHYKWARMLGFELPVPVITGILSKMSLAFIVGLPFVLGEEIGWSGFLTPKLLKVTSVPVTSLIVGLFWSVWHFPAIIGGIYPSGGPLWVSLPGFTLVLVSGSLVRTVLIAKSKTLWTGAILHASANTILMGIFWEMTVHKGYAGYLVSETGVFLGLVYLISAVIFWKMQVKKSAF